MTDHQEAAANRIVEIVALGIQAAGLVDLTETEIKEVLKGLNHEAL